MNDEPKVLSMFEDEYVHSKLGEDVDNYLCERDCIQGDPQCLSTCQRTGCESWN